MIQLDSLGIEPLKDRYPHEISGGEIQRAAIARSLLNSPKILLADEPSGNLDSANSELIVKLLRSLVDERGVTLLVVTHDLDIVKSADYIHRLEGGIIRA